MVQFAYSLVRTEGYIFPAGIASLGGLKNCLTALQDEYKELDIGNNSSMRFKMINVNRTRQIVLLTSF